MGYEQRAGTEEVACGGVQGFGEASATAVYGERPAGADAGDRATVCSTETAPLHSDASTSHTPHIVHTIHHAHHTHLARHARARRAPRQRRS
ncbi:MAG TPA: hypothetical protein VMV29_09060, partial [Ktedonobacterales bacterium]|nr:hypothetical protein [Ktedonobacterales bacterium]